MSGPSYPEPASSPDPYRPTQNPYPAGDPYQSYPGGASGPAPTRAPEPPGTVRTAFLIYLVTALISLVSVVVVLTSSVYDKAVIDAANSDTLPEGMTAQELVNITRTIAVVVGVLFLALYLLFAFKMRSGRNWARIVLTVLSALSILSVTSTGSVRVDNRTYSSSMSLISGWVGAALAILAIVFMFMAASNSYFREASAARQRR